MFTYPNKDIYSGWWRYGKKYGKGTYVFSDTGMRVSYKLMKNRNLDKVGWYLE